MSEIVEVADAVGTALNGATFSLPFTAERKFQPHFELKDMQSLHVTVVPKADESALFARIKTQYDYGIDVAVQQKLQETDESEIAPLMKLAEEIGDYFRFKRLAEFPSAIWVKTRRDPIYSQEHLQQFGQFTSVVTLTFRVIK